MTTLASRITASVRKPSITLRLDGRRVTRVLRARVSHAYGSSGLMGGTVVIRNPPVTPAEGMAVTWAWGYDTYEAPAFTGYVTRITDNSYPATWELEVQDVLWLAQREQRPIATSPLNDIDASDAIRYILETYAGLTRTDLPDIEIGGSTWTLGQLTPVSWDKTTAYAACQEIAQTAGYWLYADAGGTVRATLIERRPSNSPFRTFRRGESLLMQGAPQRVKDGNQVKNRWTVRGASTGVEGAQLFDTFLATHALYPNTVVDGEFSSPLLEYIADVTAVAERLTALWNRRPNLIRARIKGDPRLRVGMTVAIEDEGIGADTAENYFIYGLDTEFDAASGNFSQQLVLDGGVGSGGYSTIPNPVAVIAVRVLERETVDGDAITLIEVDGSGSYSLSEGEIVSYAWSIADTPYSGTANTATTALATFLIPDSEAPFSITLTVTDTSSKTGTTTVDVPLSGDVIVSEVEAVIAAGGSVAWYTPDGGATIAKEVLTCTIVSNGAGVWDEAPAADAATYGALFTSGAQVRRTLDGLGTPSTLLNTASGTITALHTNARNAARCWRAIGTALQRSIDGGTTWAAWGTLPATVRDIIEDPALDNSVFVLAGANAYNTYRADGTSPGSTWATLYAGPTGATARWMVRSDDGFITWICYTGTFSGAAVQRIEGAVNATFTGASPAVAQVRALALLQSDPSAPVLVAVDSASPARTWYGSALTGVLTQGPSLPAGGVAQHAEGSRRAPLAYIADFDSVTAATTGALRKLILGQGSGVLLPWYLGAAGEQYHMARLAPPVRAAGRVLVPTYGLSGGNSGVWENQDGAWALRSAGLPTGHALYCFSLAANPAGGNEWLAVFHANALMNCTTSGGKVVSTGSTYSPLWYWDGATWAEVEIDDAAAPSVNQRLFWVDWLTADAQWVTTIANPSGNPTAVVRGRLGATTDVDLSGTLASVGIAYATAGRDYDALLVRTVASGSTTGDRVYVQDSAGAITEPSGASGGTEYLPPVQRMEVEPSSRQAVMLEDGDTLLATSDYRATQPTSRGTVADGYNVAWATHGLYLATSAGLRIINNPISGSLSTTSIDTAYDTTDFKHVRVDRQTWGIIGAISSDDLAILYDGSAITRLTLPVTRANLADLIEVIG